MAGLQLSRWLLHLRMRGKEQCAHITRLPPSCSVWARQTRSILSTWWREKICSKGKNLLDWLTAAEELNWPGLRPTNSQHWAKEVLSGQAAAPRRSCIWKITPDLPRGHTQRHHSSTVARVLISLEQNAKQRSHWIILDTKLIVAV